MNRDLTSLLIASHVNKSLTEYDGEAQNFKIEFGLLDFFKDLQRFIKQYHAKFSPSQFNDPIKKDEVISIIKEKFSGVINIVNDKVVIDVIPESYEKQISRIIVDSSYDYSRYLIKSIDDLSKLYLVANENDENEIQMSKKAKISATSISKSEVRDDAIEEKKEDLDKDSDKYKEEMENSEKHVGEEEKRNKEEDKEEHKEEGKEVGKEEEKEEEKEEDKEEEKEEDKEEEKEEDKKEDISKVEEKGKGFNGEVANNSIVLITDNNEDALARKTVPSESFPGKQDGALDEDVVMDEQESGSVNESISKDEERKLIEKEIGFVTEENKVEEENIGAESLAVENTQQVVVEEPQTAGDETGRNDKRLANTSTDRKRSRSPAQHKRFQHIAINLINSISAHRFSSPFLQAVNKKEAPDYYDLIYEPRDLKNILRQIKQKSDPPVYSSIKQLERDIMLMFANCIMYNQSKDDLIELTVSMKNDVTNLFKLFEEAESDLK